MSNVILDCFVPGIPAPQGSKKAFYIKKLGRAVIVEDSKRTRPWRRIVTDMALAEKMGTAPHGVAVRLQLAFGFPRPKGHFRADGTLKPTAARHHVVRPDRDKCERAICDALKDASVFADDSQVVDGPVEKHYVQPGENPGVRILVEVLL